MTCHVLASVPLAYFAWLGILQTYLNLIRGARAEHLDRLARLEHLNGHIAAAQRKQANTDERPATAAVVGTAGVATTVAAAALSDG